MLQEQTISNIIKYPVDENGAIVTRRGGLTRMKPKLGAPPSNQPGSVHWTMLHLFGETEKAIQMIESLVAGQGDNADEKWIRFVLLYRQWEQQYRRGELLETPNFNQVCHSLDFEATSFISQLQSGIQSLMKGMAQMKASLASPMVVQNLIDKATSEEADVKEIELALKVGGIVDEKGGVNINVNQQTAVMLKGEKDKQKSPLLQFSDTVTEIDNEVRKEHSNE